jgi:two-component system sensor histidine kinase/response regulator
MPGREHFSGLLDVASDPIWSISLDGLQLLHINEDGSSAFGRSRESMLESDREWQLLIQEEDRVLLNDRFSEIKTIQSFSQKFRILNLSGPPEIFQGHFRLLNSPDPSRQFIAATAHNAARGNPFAQRQEETLAIYDSLLESLPINVFRKDLDGKIVFANNRYCSDLGLAREEVLGKTDFDFFEQKTAEKYHADDQRVLTTGALFHDTEVHPSGDGAIHVEVLKAVVTDQNSHPIGIQATLEIRQLESARSVRVPIIALTAHASADDRKLCLESGMDEYIAKPFRAHELIKLVRLQAGRQPPKVKV